jgi:hypothetical protein
MSLDTTTVTIVLGKWWRSSLSDERYHSLDLNYHLLNDDALIVVQIESKFEEYRCKND